MLLLLRGRSQTSTATNSAHDATPKTRSSPLPRFVVGGNLLVSFSDLEISRLLRGAGWQRSDAGLPPVGPLTIVGRRRVWCRIEVERR